jgi:uncharacterized membrane protein YgcG
MKRLSTLAALVLITGLAAAPALAARSSYVIDQAAMLSPDAVTRINSEVSSLAAQTGKEVVVQTVATTAGVPIRDAASKAFSDQGVNGVLIFIAKDDRKDFIMSDRAGTQAGWFSPEIFAPIYSAMGAQFKNGDYDGGVTTAVESILGIYRSHLNSFGNGNGAPAPLRQQTASTANYPATGGFHLSMFWLIVLLVVAFLVIRSILRAMSAPRAGYGGPPVAPGAPGYGSQGYGPGYGGMGGGGSFFSGLLGGLGGAFLGNELFRGGGGSLGGGGGTDQGGSWGGGNAPSDGGGWTSDAGAGDASSGGGGGDWSGGGFDGGGGDFGGGGGGDSGGGW